MAELKTKYKHIRFEKCGEDWQCTNKHEESMGIVEYYIPWRRFVFEPFAGFVYSHDCLADISHFLQQLNGPSPHPKGE